MKTTILVGLMAVFSGCSLVTQPPSEAKARSLEARRSAAETAAHVGVETKKLEDKGLTSQEARSLAEAQRQSARP